MKITETDLPGVKLVAPPRFSDQRGFFSETYNKRALAAAGVELDFVQDNHSLSREKGVVRGLHFQVPPFAQDKLIRVIHGAVFDVVVDVRRSSPTFGRHLALVLQADAWRQLLVPAGFAHGFATLEPNTEIAYKVTNYYSPKHDRGILWNDPALGIPWPVSPREAVLSAKDRHHPPLGEAPELFD